MPAHIPKLSEKMFFLFSGAIMSVPFSLLTNSLASYFLLLNLPRIYAIVLSIVILAPILEEFAKSYPLFYRHCETQRSIFILGFLTGLGFGIVEFFVYVFVYQISIFVRLPLVLFHATNTSIITYGIGRNRIFAFYLIAVLLHGLNNFGAINGGILQTISFFAIIISYALSFYLYLRTKNIIYNSGLI